MPAPFPKVLGNGLLGKTAMAVNQLLIRVSRSMFSYQIFVVAEATPDVDFILEDARRRSELRDRAATRRQRRSDVGRGRGSRRPAATSHEHEPRGER